MKGIKIFLGMILAGFQGCLIAQDSLRAVAVSHDEKSEVLKRYFTPVQVSDSLSAIREFLKVIGELQSDGYLLASLDTIGKEGSNYKGVFFVGNKYQWGQVNNFRVLHSSRRSSGGIVSKNEMDRLIGKKLKTANNSGFPFAMIRLDSITISGQEISGVINFESGPLIKFDTLQLKSGDHRRQRYLSNYLRIQPGAPYSEKKVQQLPVHIDQLPYYDLTSSPEMVFHNNQATVSIDVERIRSNSFDGVIGFLPNSARDNKLLITGELNLQLLNMFESGKEFRLHWQRLKEESQYLDLWLKFPGVLNSPLDLTGGYRQLKEDTTFVNRNSRLGASMRVSPRSEVNFFVDFKSADLLSTRLVDVEESPDNLDFNLSRYGAAYRFRTLNSRDFFDEGVDLSIELSVGTKKIRRNANLDDSLYEGLNLTTSFYQVETENTYQKEIGRFGLIYQKIRFGKMINDHIFRNDMFRVGGLNSLRGFNENFFFANTYLLSNLELRFPFDQSSFLFLFYDQSFIVTSLNDEDTKDHPLGFGLGLQFRTAGGDFKFAYALGHSDTRNVTFNQSKIHFGIINRF